MLRLVGGLCVVSILVFAALSGLSEGVLLALFAFLAAAMLPSKERRLASSEE